MYHTKRRYSATNKIIKSCKRFIYHTVAILQHKTQQSTSITGKAFSYLYTISYHKLSSLGLWWTLKIGFSIVSIIAVVAIMMSMWDKSWVMVFADNSLNIKPVDDGYISLDGAILDSNAWDPWARFSYMIKAWDTLDSIAYEFGVTIKSLKNTNNLTSSTIKAWQEIIISSVDGFVYQMDKPMTIRDFALKYRLDLQDVKELNALQNDHDALAIGDQVFVPLTLEEGKKMWLIIPEPEPVIAPIVQLEQSKKTTKSATTNATKTAVKTTTTTKSSWWMWRVSQTRASCFGFVPWQCTCYAAQKRPDIFKAWQARPFGWNAKNWYNNAKNAWFAVGTKPAIGAVAVMPVWRGGYWHVGIVVDIDGDQILLESMNWIGNYIVNRVWIDVSRVRWYIY